MNNLKKFVKTQKGKSILFFGFYLVFFIILAIFMRNNLNKESMQDDKKIENNVWTINKVINLDDYVCKVVINDDGNTEINYEARKKDISYDLDKNMMYYFLDIYNINKLIKKSKLIEIKDKETIYEVSNETLNELLETEINDGINKIMVIEDANYLKIVLDLHEYQQKDIYNISLEYRGVDDE